MDEGNEIFELWADPKTIMRNVWIYRAISVVPFLLFIVFATEIFNGGGLKSFGATAFFLLILVLIFYGDRLSVKEAREQPLLFVLTNDGFTNIHGGEEHRWSDFRAITTFKDMIWFTYRKDLQKSSFGSIRAGSIGEPVWRDAQRFIKNVVPKDVKVKF